MAGKTSIQIPANITDQTVLKRFLFQLITYVDTAIGLKGASKVITEPNLIGTLVPYATQSWVTTTLVPYATQSWVTDTLVPYATQSWVTTNFTNNPIQANITTLAQTISSTYTQSEVQAISTKVDNIIATLALAKIIA